MTSNIETAQQERVLVYYRYYFQSHKSLPVCSNILGTGDELKKKVQRNLFISMFFFVL